MNDVELGNTCRELKRAIRAKRTGARDMHLSKILKYIDVAKPSESVGIISPAEELLEFLGDYARFLGGRPQHNPINPDPLTSTIWEVLSNLDCFVQRVKKERVIK